VTCSHWGGNSKIGPEIFFSVSIKILWDIDIPVPKSPGDVSWKGLIEETSPGLNLEKFASVSKNLRKFSLSEWQFIGLTTKQRIVFFQPARTAGFSPWHRDIPVPKSPGDVSWIKLQEVGTSEQTLEEEVFTFTVAVY
jgi:hypothetical protein